MSLLQVSVWLQVSLLISLTTQLSQAAPAGPIPDNPEVRQVRWRFDSYSLDISFENLFLKKLILTNSSIF